MVVFLRSVGLLIQWLKCILQSSSPKTDAMSPICGKLALKWSKYVVGEIAPQVYVVRWVVLPQMLTKKPALLLATGKVNLVR